MSKSALVFLAPGAEEMEVVIIVDMLRRGGMEVSLVSICDASPTVKCCRDVVIGTDIVISEVKGPYDIMIVPGGLGGTMSLMQSKTVGELLKKQENEGRWIAALCGAPKVLKAHRIALGKSLTSNPRLKTLLENDYNYKEDDVVIDGKLITARGPGTAFEFTLTIIDQIVGKEKATSIAKGLRLPFFN